MYISILLYGVYQFCVMMWRLDPIKYHNISIGIQEEMVYFLFNILHKIFYPRSL